MKFRIAGTFVTMVFAAGLNGCTDTKQVTYADVEPILKEKCGECHTDDREGVQASGFSVDSYQTVMKGTKLGPVVVAESSESSTLYRMVAGETHPSIQMPHGEDPLSDEQIETIRIWIDQGAKK
jgi:hypothetical protein